MLQCLCCKHKPKQLWDLLFSKQLNRREALIQNKIHNKLKAFSKMDKEEMELKR